MPPRQIPTGQGRLAFGVVPRSVAADTAGATVKEDDQDDEVVLVAEQQKQQKGGPIRSTLQRMICTTTCSVFLPLSLLLSL